MGAVSTSVPKLPNASSHLWYRTRHAKVSNSFISFCSASGIRGLVIKSFKRRFTWIFGPAFSDPDTYGRSSPVRRRDTAPKRSARPPSRSPSLSLLPLAPRSLDNCSCRSSSSSWMKTTTALVNLRTTLTLESLATEAKCSRFKPPTMVTAQSPTVPTAQVATFN
ncbi:hypothetical protein T439DRAFT_243460 [Meredithblackwellia eburnea MCA 4105]